MPKHRQRSSAQPDTESEQHPYRPSEVTTVSEGFRVLLGISPDDSDPEEN